MVIRTEIFHIALALLYLNKYAVSTSINGFKINSLINEINSNISREINQFARTYDLQDIPSNGLKFKIPEDAKLDFKGIVKKYGHKCEEHHIISSDGYITTVYRLPGDTKRTLCMLHGIFDSSDTFVIRGNTSMGITFANAGYDVWILNMRGNKHSRKHKTLNPDKDAKFWDFSYHEMALYDLPRTIDYILKMTGQKKLYAIGHSLGNSIFFAMMSMLPQYNEKIKMFISMAPAPYIQNIRSLLAPLVPFSGLLNFIGKAVGTEELFKDGSQLQKVLPVFCQSSSLGYLLCIELLVSTLAGRDPEELEREFFPVVLTHVPCGTSRKNLNHLSQSGKYKRFARYDVGIKNLDTYGKLRPPVYDLSAVTMKVAIFCGGNDALVVVEDVNRTRDELGNVVHYTILEKFNHIDFIWGKNAHTIMYPSIFKLFQKY